MKTLVKRFVLVLLAGSLISMVGCRSSQSVKLLEPEIEIAQITNDSFIMQYRTSVSIEYRLRVHNLSEDEITLKRLDLQTLSGGPYILRNTPEHFKLTVSPGETKTVEFAMWGYSLGGRSASVEPVVLSGTAHFDTPNGPMSTKFIRRIQQPRGQTRG